jgi:hypothetical protein
VQAAPALRRNAGVSLVATVRERENVTGAQVYVAARSGTPDDLVPTLPVQNEEQFSDVVDHRMGAARGDIHDLVVDYLERRTEVGDLV